MLFSSAVATESSFQDVSWLEKYEEQHVLTKKIEEQNVLIKKYGEQNILKNATGNYRELQIN